jgi:ATP-binding cassette, subfamily B, vacuolar membrane transporter HMT1/ACLQ
VALYYVAGLLPDPADEFAPGPTALCVWIVNIIFEGVLRVLSEMIYSPLSKSPLVLGILRMTALLMMISAYVAARYDQVVKTVQSEDTESLLGSDRIRSNGYGAINGDNSPAAQPVLKPKAGWLDYFIGFRVLFPYIW